MSVSKLPEPTTYITTHDNDGKSIVLPPRTQQWVTYDDGQMPWSVPYIAKMPADLNNDADLTDFDRKAAAGELGLVSSDSALLHYVDLAPGYTCMMHRTKSIDYGILLAGEVECVMDSGEVQAMKHGDVMVQRYTKHAWRNSSETEWARIIFVLMDCLPLRVKGEVLGEDLGRGEAFVPSSENA